MRIGEILIRSIAYPVCFLFAWLALYIAFSFLATFSSLIGIYGDDQYRLAAIVSFLTTCYSFWVMSRPVKTSAQLKAEVEEWNTREYMRGYKRMQREAAWAERSKLYRFMTSGGAFAILLALLLLWSLFSQLI